MTVREFIHNAKYWFAEGWEKIIDGNFLDLTIGQAVLVLLIIGSFYNLLVEIGKK